MLKGLFVTISLLFIIFINAQSIHYKDSIIIQAKVWNKNKEKQVSYSNWKPYISRTIEMIDGFDSSPLDKNLDEYGGSSFLKSKNTGFFRVEKINNRFWFIDPLGNSFFNTAVNGIRPGTSTDANKALNIKYGNLSNWIDKTNNAIFSIGFNSAGSWSDLNSILDFNKKTKNHFVYCTQLSLLGNMMHDTKKKKENKDYPILALVFNSNFENYCREKLLENKDKFNDPNLLGHFSDNELPFQENVLSHFLDINDESDEAYQFAKKYVLDNQINPSDISKEQQEKFAGIVASKYFEIVSATIKKYDPNHLYLGSRLHSSAKNNIEVLKAAEIYLDVISINFYGHWDLRPKENELWGQLKKPFIITEFYTKGEDTKMQNLSGAGWIVSTQKDRGIHYQNFMLSFLPNKNFIGLHWFRYQDNDPNDKSSDPSNMDSNKGLVNTEYNYYEALINAMSQINNRKYRIINFIDSIK
jgi:hypothetical protein